MGLGAPWFRFISSSASSLLICLSKPVEGRIAFLCVLRPSAVKALFPRPNKTGQDPRDPAPLGISPGDKTGAYSAPSPTSPVRTRTTSSIGMMKILPSPIRPVWAQVTMTLMIFETISSGAAISNRALGSKST